MPPAIRQALLQQADWLLYDLMPQRQEALWIQLGAADLRQASFLDQRVLPAAANKIRTPLALLQSATSDQPLRWIFHCGHVASTLLSRLLDAPPGRVLREPQVLRTTAAMVQESNWPWAQYSPAACADWLAAVCRLLSKTTDAGDGVLIKATSSTTNLMPLITQQRSHDRAVALAAPLDLYLAVMLRSEGGRHDVNGFIQQRMQQFCGWLEGAPSLPLHQFSEAQKLALSWLVSLWPMAQAVNANPDRCRWLDFATLMEHTEVAVADVRTMLDWSGAVASDAELARYAKDPAQPFDSASRWRQLSQLRQQQAAQAETLYDWLAKLCQPLPAIQQWLQATRQCASMEQLNTGAQSGAAAISP